MYIFFIGLNVKGIGADNDSSLAYSIQMVEEIYSDPDSLINLGTAQITEISDLLGL